MTRRRSLGSAGRSSRATAGVETTPRTGEGDESEESESLSSSESSSSIGVATCVTGIEIGVVVVTAVFAREFRFADDRLVSPRVKNTGNPASS